MEGRVRRGGLVWPVILIGAGIIFLLNNLGIVSWSVWGVLWRLWPLLLIAVGLDILVGRRSLLGSLLVVVVVLGLFGAAVIYWMPQYAGNQDLRTEQINQGLDGARQASVDISVGTANAQVKEGLEAAGLIQGSVMLAGREQLSTQFQKNGDTAVYRLGAENSDVTTWPVSLSDPGVNQKQWDLQLSPAVPMRLKVNGGVGNTTLDLSRLKLLGLDVNAGVGNVTVNLPANGQFQANLDAGVGRLRVMIPAGMAARITADRGLGGLDVNGNFERQGDRYVSPNYSTAADRVELKVNGGIGQVIVEQANEG